MDGPVVNVCPSCKGPMDVWSEHRPGCLRDESSHDPAAAYVPEQGAPSLERKLADNANGAGLEPEWHEVRIVMRDRDNYRGALRQIAAIKPDATQWVEQNTERLRKAVALAREALDD